jgi:hypothetical protein
MNTVFVNIDGERRRSPSMSIRCSSIARPTISSLLRHGGWHDLEIPAN